MQGQEVPSHSVSDGSIYCDQAWFKKFTDEFFNIVYKDKLDLLYKQPHKDTDS